MYSLPLQLRVSRVTVLHATAVDHDSVVTLVYEVNSCRDAEKKGIKAFA